MGGIGDGGQILAFYADPKGTWASFLVQFFLGGITLCKLSVQTSGNFMAICLHKITVFSLLDADVIYQ